MLRIVGLSYWMIDDYDPGNTPGIVRAYSGGIFSYYAQASQSNVARNQIAKITNNWSTRAVVVSGQGL